MSAGVRCCLAIASLCALGCQGGGDEVIIIVPGGNGTGGTAQQSGGSSGNSSGAGGVMTGTGGATGGQPGTGGSGGIVGVSGSGGTPAMGGGAGTGGAPFVCGSPWPSATSTENVSATIEVPAGTVYDGGFKRLIGTGPLGTGGQLEDQPPVFRLGLNAVIKNVILGGPAADGIHCDGTCLLQNIWWEDVGEDAATLDGESSSQVMTIECSGARQAVDKVFQHNGPGTMVLRNVWADGFSKFYRSCGNCIPQHYPRHVELYDITLSNGSVIVGLNENYGDTAEFTNITVNGGITVCQRYIGNDMGLDTVLVGEGPDAQHCLYDNSDIN